MVVVTLELDVRQSELARVMRVTKKPRNVTIVTLLTLASR